MFLRSEYGYDMHAASLETAIDASKDGRTQQSFKDECDINILMKRFLVGGQLPVDVRMPTYGDFTGVSNFHEAVNAVRSASEAFMEMPPEVRARFDNDAGKFVDFCSDDANIEEARKLGLIPAAELPPAPPAPMAVRIVQDDPLDKPA